MRRLTRRKLTSAKVVGLASVLIASGLLASCKAITTRTEYEYTRLEVTNDGEYREVRQFKPFDAVNNKNLPNSFIYYGKWEETTDQKYSREVREYNVNNKTYDDIKELTTNSNLPIEEVLGEPSKTYMQVTDYVEDEELVRDAHFEATLYSKDENRKVTIVTDDPASTNSLIFGASTLTLGVGTLIAWNQYEKKLTLKKREN